MHRKRHLMTLRHQSKPFLVTVFHEPFPLQDKAKRSAFDECKAHLVVQGQHMRLKGEDGVSVSRQR